MSTRYRGDPYWLRAKFTAICSGCGGPIKVGDHCFYYPNTKAIFCAAEDCGKRMHREFAEAAEDEAMYNNR